MANLTLAIPADLKAEMKKCAEINWSEVARQAITEAQRRVRQYIPADAALVDRLLYERRQEAQRE
ncbi:hypothetical protein [Candidatus Methylomirabilis sp.]|uniref:hypothetical protein n=1 Tax=Candidatus Methylomirabilis sp. TaxID=2032687 RepID=UPI0030762058